MIASKATTLPHVLNEYLPEYPASEISQKNEAFYSTKEQHDEERNKKGRKSSPRRAPSRERTLELIKKQNKERYERQFQNWQEVKVLYREQQTREFQKKAALQKQLIDVRDNLRQIRQREEDEENQKIRAADRSAKQAQVAILENICKLSLDEDRQKRKELLKSRKKKPGGANSSNNASTDDYKVPDDTIPITSRKGLPLMGRKTGAGAEKYTKPNFQERMPTDLSTHSSLVSGPLHHLVTNHPPTPVYEGAEEDEEEEESASTTDASLTRSPTRNTSELPWHHQQLYQLYGQAADDFLHPKFEDKKKTVVAKPINPKLHRQGVNAGELWTELRQDSRMKLLKEDSTIPTELKYAYSAFVRQLLGRRRMPVKRNFYDKEDVPDLDILMDQSRIRDAQDYKHKCEIMYRASHMNEDKSRVLLYNNPPPDLNNWEGFESCGRYMPSWVDSLSESESELSYNKWLPGPRVQVLKQVEENTLSHPGTEDKSVDIQKKAQLDTAIAEDDIEFIVSAKRPKQHQSKYLFLTEKAARCDGEFSKRYREAEELKTRPQAFNDKANATSQSAMAMFGDYGTSLPNSAMSGTVGSRRTRSQSEMSNRFVSKWQPLSLGALVEYKHNVKALGDGDFAYGKTPTWKIESPA